MTRTAVAVALALLAAGCGKYGPPTREPEERARPEAATPPTPSSERIAPPGEFREDPDPDEETR